MKTTACPMDCFDACEIIYNEGTCKPSKIHPITQGSLCKPFAYLLKEQNIKDKDINNTLNQIANKLKQKDQKILYYKGTGNISVTQNIPKIFFEKIKATIAEGSICETAGVAGIEYGRKYSVNPDIEELLSSDIIVAWGRNLSVTSKHIYKLIKDKKFITIDPYETYIAKKSEEFIQIPPKGDYQLIKELSKALNNEILDEDMLKSLNTTKEQIYNIISLLKNKKVSFLVGLGAQKYKEGAQIIHALDTFANNFGVFTNKNIGMWYLGDSKYMYDDKTAVTLTNTISYPSVDFSCFDIVFIQGANPAVSAPNTSRVIEGLKKAFVIYFGTTQNETSKYANIILPAKTFLQKKDVRVSYGHDEVIFSEVCEENRQAVSEYEFTKYMFDTLNLDGLSPLQEYLELFKTKKRQKPDIVFKPHKIKDIPLLKLEENEYYLLTSKYVNTINSQFKYDNSVYVNPKNGFKNNQEISISSKYAEIKARVKNDENVHINSLLFYAGHKNVNYLTPHIPSDMGNNAIFQDIVLRVKNIK